MAAALQITGATLVSVGVGFMFPPAGIALAGAFCIAFGVALEFNKERNVNAG